MGRIGFLSTTYKSASVVTVKYADDTGFFHTDNPSVASYYYDNVIFPFLSIRSHEIIEEVNQLKGRLMYG